MAHTQPTSAEVKAVAAAFAFAGEITDIKTNGNGHINSTYIVSTLDGAEKRRYILQILNTDIFKHPDEVMENIVAVTEHIRAGLVAAGEDAVRGTMRVVKTREGANGFVDAEGRYWRAYDFVEGTVCRLMVDSPATFERVGEAFGDFQRRLSDFDASRLYDSIPDFHNTKKRYANFLEVVAADPVGRVASVKEEIDFILARADRAPIVVDALASGDLPLRVTHNDTKLSNILLDEKTDEAVCIIDLDTVMPGSSLYDFGDSIRTGAASAAEDEKDLDKVHFLPEMFYAYARGFIKGTAGALTDREMAMLPDGGYIITFEQAIRFLVDYLNGDTYYHTEYPDHNLVRTRTQIKLVAEMEACMDDLYAFCRK